MLAEKQDYVKSIFIGPARLSAEGIYLLRLCVDGQWQFVFIDDALPCNKDSRLIFSEVRFLEISVFSQSHSVVLCRAEDSSCGCL